MKNILCLLVFVFGVALAGYSQNDADYDKSLSYASTYLVYTGDATDTIGDGDSTWMYTAYKKSYSRTYPKISVKVDSIKGTAADVYFIHQYKSFAFESYTNGDTVTWAGTTADTSFTIDVSTASKSDYHRLLMKGSTDSFNAGISNLGMNFKQ